MPAAQPLQTTPLSIYDPEPPVLNKYTGEETMRFHEFAQPSKPKTPDQARVAALKQTKDRANDALQKERDRQKVQKAQKAITQVKLASV